MLHHPPTARKEVSGTTSSFMTWRRTGRSRGRHLPAYVITRRGRHEVYLVDRYGGSTLGWSLPEEAWTPGDNAFGNIAIHGDRLVFAETAHLSDEDMGEEGTLYLARPGDPQAQPLLTLPGRLGPRGSNSVRWSPDGRLLTVSYHPPEREGPRGLLLVEIDESGELVGEPRIVSAEGGPDWLFGVQWMPDGQHFLALGGQEESGVDRDVWLLSLDPETPPVKLTSDLQEPIWYYRLSPDGRYITFDSEMPRGSSVWRVDLGEIPAGSGVNHARPA
jgi:dipeptidyl aminopeptidase/acylaminoacyl peptidase